MSTAAALKRKLEELSDTCDARAREAKAETRKRALQRIGSGNEWKTFANGLVSFEEWKLSLTNMDPKDYCWRAAVTSNLLAKLTDDWSFFPDLYDVLHWAKSKDIAFTNNQLLQVVRRRVDERVASGFAEAGKNDMAGCSVWLAPLTQTSKSEPFSEDLAHIIRAFWSHDQWTDEERELFDDFGDYILQNDDYAELPLPNPEVCFFFTPRKSFDELHAFFLDPASPYRQAQELDRARRFQEQWESIPSPPVVSEDEADPQEEDGEVDVEDAVASLIRAAEQEELTEADYIALHQGEDDTRW